MQVLNVYKKESKIQLPIKEIVENNLNVKIETKEGYKFPSKKHSFQVNENLYKIKTKDFSLKLTKDHPCITSIEKEKQAKDITLEDIFYTKKGEQKIESIKKLHYQGKVYDFTIPEEENFYANGILTHNCRLRLDLKELRKKGNGLFGAYDSTGSIGVVSINFGRLGYESKKETQSTDEIEIEKTFYKKLDELLELCFNGLSAKRAFINKMLKDGMYPYTEFYLGHYENHFETIGVIGVNECLRNMYNIDIASEKGLNFSIKLLNYMRDKISAQQAKTGTLYNLEEIPGESACYRFAKHDLEQYPDIITAGTKSTPYYTNSTHLPVDYTSDVWFTLKHQEQLQTLYTGGCVVHIFLGQPIESWKVARDLIKKICYTTKIPYITLTPTYSICPIHGFIPGKHERCPTCKEIQIQNYKKELEKLEAQVQ
jgi:ribonucleoside-triphosphate reductase